MKGYIDRGLVAICVMLAMLVGALILIAHAHISCDVMVDTGGFNGDQPIHDVVKVEQHTEGFKITCEDGTVHYTGKARVEIKKKGLVVE